MVDRKNNKVPLLGENLAAVLQSQLWGNQQHLFPLARHWPEIVGQGFAEHSMPAFFRRNVLWVYVQGSVWMQQMQLVKPELLSGINAFLHSRRAEVEDLRWQQQPADMVEVPEQEYVPPQVSVDSESERRFRIMADNIGDPEIRRALYNLWLRLTTKNNSV